MQKAVGFEKASDWGEIVKTFLLFWFFHCHFSVLWLVRWCVCRRYYGWRNSLLINSVSQKVLYCAFLVCLVGLTVSKYQCHKSIRGPASGHLLGRWDLSASAQPTWTQLILCELDYKGNISLFQHFDRRQKLMRTMVATTGLPWAMRLVKLLAAMLINMGKK